VAETATNRGKTRIAAGDTSLDSSDLRMLVILGTQTGVNDPDLNTVADLDAVTSVSIHSERLALASLTVTEDDTNNRANADCANLSFAAAPGVTAQGVAIYDEGGGTDATRHVLFIYTTGFPQPMDGGLNVTVNDYARLS
jgi:hypothetical protein